MNKKQLTEGLAGLKQPVIPLIRIIHFLFLTGPFSTISEILEELNEPIDTNAVIYDDPKITLLPYLHILQEFESLKNDNSSESSYIIYSQDGKLLDSFEAMAAWVSHHMLIEELERINSQLCGPCKCDLCCIGPDSKHNQEFFEIPLSIEESALFPLERHDSSHSRQLTPYSDTSLKVDGNPFFYKTPKIVNWQSGWSLILPKETICPHLEKNQKICQIYPDRPTVCRRPQIFSYILERHPEKDHSAENTDLLAYTLTNKLLAIWDCPYVQVLQDEIAAYAEICELEPIFKQNKE